MSPNLDLKQGISYLEREREREIKEIDRKIEGRGIKTADNKNPKQSWVAQLVSNRNTAKPVFNGLSWDLTKVAV
jgi:hypothetical protein